MKALLETSHILQRALLTTLLAAICLPSSATAQDQRHPALAGTWRVKAALVNCQSGVQTGPPFHSYLTFGRDGTLIEATNNPAFAPGQRSSGHGFWKHQEENAYYVVSEAFILFTTAPNLPNPGFSQGVQRIEQSIELNGDSFSSVATVTFKDASGNVVRQGCAVASGQRIS